MDKSKYSEEKIKEIEYLFSNYEMLERVATECKSDILKLTIHKMRTI